MHTSRIERDRDWSVEVCYSIARATQLVLWLFHRKGLDLEACPLYELEQRLPSPPWPPSSAPPSSSSRAWSIAISSARGTTCSSHGSTRRSAETTVDMPAG